MVLGLVLFAMIIGLTMAGLVFASSGSILMALAIYSVSGVATILLMVLWIVIRETLLQHPRFAARNAHDPDVPDIVASAPRRSSTR